MGTITLENGEKKKFCAKLPWQNARGHDIYGNPFPNPTVAGGKKGKKAQAAQAEAETASNADSPAEDTPAVMGKAAKNSGIVYFKCTNCDNEKVTSLRYAAHLEKCLGLSGRKSSRAAMAKMNNSGPGSNGGSPMLLPTDAAKGASRKPSPEKLAIGNAGTPAPEDPLGMTIDVALPPPVSKPNLPAPTAPVGVAATTTPKKKKKAAAAAAAAGDVKEGTPMPSIPPPAVTPAPKDPTQKKRKRKDELGEPGTAPLKQKKQKTLLTGAGVTGSPHPPSTPTTNVTGTPKTKFNKLNKPTANSDSPLNTNSLLPPQPLAASMSPQKAPASLPKKPPKPKAQRPPKVGGTAGISGLPKKTASAGAGGSGDSPKKVKKKALKAGAVGAGNVADKTVPGVPRVGVAGKSVLGLARKGLPGGGGSVGSGGNV